MLLRTQFPGRGHGLTLELGASSLDAVGFSSATRAGSGEYFPMVFSSQLMKTLACKF